MAGASLPTQARVVIIGGGIVGCSIAYHLTTLGWKDVLLLERKELTCGTTWHAAGLITTLRHTENQTRLARYSQELYKELEAITGQSTGFRQVGSIQIAASRERAREMRRGRDMARCFGVQVEEISATEIRSKWPLAETQDIHAGFYFPDDGRANPTDTTQALAKGVRQGGATILQNVKVDKVRTNAGRVTGVVTEYGEISCEYAVNCTGMWARELGARNNVNIPLQAAEHYYLITEAIEGVHAELPILRDPDNRAYFREETGKIMLGIFEDVAAPWALDGVPEDFSFDELAPDWDRLTPYLERAMRRIPVMRDSGIQLLFCGPESFTADHNYFMGEAPDLAGYFVAAGFNSLGVLSAGGVGLVMAQWITTGHPPMDVFDVDIKRTHNFQNNPAFLRDRTVESLGLVYQNHWPYRQFDTARNIKKLVLHDRLVAANACFGESAGWERPNWYAPAGARAEYEYSFGRPGWFEHVAAEHRAVRENIGVFEQSSFTKLLVQGRDAEAFLNRLATNDMSVPVGKIIYTQFLNSRGGIEADITITRTGETEYLIVTPAFTSTHVCSWLKNHLGSDEFAVLTDVSANYGILNIQGPRARELLQALTDADMSARAFPFATMQFINIGYSRIMALRVSYTGELGWELFIPTEFLQQTYDSIIERGAEFGLKHCGYHALNSLRIERAFREFAHDIGADDNPVEAGLDFTCRFNKPAPFIGQEKVEAMRADGPPKRRLLQFMLTDPEPMLYHVEPIFRNGEMLGYTSSGMYGFTLGAAVALGYISNPEGVSDEFVTSGNFEICVEGRKYPAIASCSAFYEPDGKRCRA